MGLDAVIAEIMEKGRIEAEAISRETDSKKNEILMTAKQKCETLKVTAREDIEKNISHIISQEVAAGHLIVKRQILNAQKGLMDEVYRMALEKVIDMPESFHKKTITSLLRKAHEVIPEGKVSCCGRDEKILIEILKDSEFSGYSFGSVIGTDGGVIVESTDGQLQMDFSFHMFLNQAWESGLKEASDILFA